MKLHYSQTDQLWGMFTDMVSVPYEITLLSNDLIGQIKAALGFSTL